MNTGRRQNFQIRNEFVHRDDEDRILKLLDVLGGCSTLGVEMDYITMTLGERQRKCLLKITLIDAGKLIGNLRTYKDQEEIEKIQTAAS